MMSVNNKSRYDVNNPHLLVFDAFDATNYPYNVEKFYNKFPGESIEEIGYRLNYIIIKEVFPELHRINASKLHIVNQYLFDRGSTYESIAKVWNVPVSEVEKYIKEFYRMLIYKIESIPPVCIDFDTEEFDQKVRVINTLHRLKSQLKCLDHVDDEIVSMFDDIIKDNLISLGNKERNNDDGIH